MSIIRLLSVLSLLSMTATVSSIRAQEVAYIDLSTVQIPKSGPPEFKVGGFVSPSMIPRRVFEVALCPVETEPFDPSATAKIDVTITNISDKSIGLPWSVDWRQVWEGSGEMPDNYLGMNLSIHARRLPGPDEIAPDRKGWERSIALALCSFYGTRTKPTTIQVLAPGRRVRVRTSVKLPEQAGEWQLRGSVSFPSGLDPHFYAASDPVLLTIRSSEQGNNTP
jgi:hypothetical protein